MELWIKEGSGLDKIFDYASLQWINGYMDGSRWVG